MVKYYIYHFRKRSIEELAACSLHLMLSKVEKLRRVGKFKKKKSFMMFIMCYFCYSSSAKC